MNVVYSFKTSYPQDAMNLAGGVDIFWHNKKLPAWGV